MQTTTTTRRNITQPADWWAEFETAAKRDGSTLSAWIGKRCVEGLPASAQAEISARPPAHRPTKTTD